jgi:hypothetical protein
LLRGEVQSAANKQKANSCDIPIPQLPKHGPPPSTPATNSRTAHALVSGSVYEYQGSIEQSREKTKGLIDLGQ